MNENRHRQVVNADEVPSTNLSYGNRFQLTRKQLGMAAGARKLGCTLVELPPGKRSWPLHYHAANEEALYILEGQGRVRIGDRDVSVRAGDYVALLSGPRRCAPDVQRFHFRSTLSLYFHDDRARGQLLSGIQSGRFFCWVCAGW